MDVALVSKAQDHVLVTKEGDISTLLVPAAGTIPQGTRNQSQQGVFHTAAVGRTEFQAGPLGSACAHT